MTNSHFHIEFLFQVSAIGLRPCGPVGLVKKVNSLYQETWGKFTPAPYISHYRLSGNIFPVIEVRQCASLQGARNFSPLLKASQCSPFKVFRQYSPVLEVSPLMSLGNAVLYYRSQTI